MAHLYQVHNPVIFAGIDLSTMWSKYLSFACHKWTASWTQNPAPEEHIGFLSLTHDLNVFGKSLSPLFLSVQARQVCTFIKSNVVGMPPTCGLGEKKSKVRPSFKLQPCATPDQNCHFEMSFFSLHLDYLLPHVIFRKLGLCCLCNIRNSTKIYKLGSKMAATLFQD